MAKHKEYWEKRFELLEDAQNRKAIEYFAELEKQYNKAALSVQDDINKWYARFAVNNEISLQEAKKMLNANELKEFKWNVMEYIEKGETLNYSDAWAKQLENASARWHISRLEALKLQMQNHVEVLYGNELDEVTALMTDIYTDGYYHTAYEIQKGFNIGYDLMKLDKNRIDKVLSKPWTVDGSNFSDRIWKQKNQLVSELHNNLTQAIIRGQDPRTVTKMISERFNVSKGRASALVMTESAFFSSASDRDCFKDLGVERYEILATLDHSTSDICRSLDGKVLPMSEYAVGVTAPPFHVRCRTTTVPFFDDEFELDTTRAARDEDGKTYQVPASMKYEDWKNSFVDGGSKKDLTPINDIDSADSESVLDSVQKMNDDDTLENIAEKEHNVVEGMNVIGEWQPSGEYEHTIDDIIHTQGYDGKPMLVDADEFDEAMKKSNFYAERTYSADTQELLDDYRNQLYDGKFYTDCSTGGAQYGQGMYTAACYDIADSEHMAGVKLEMADYKKVGTDAGRNYSYTESITLQPDAKILELPHNAKAEEYISEVYRNEYVRKFAKPEQKAQVDRYIELNETINNLTYTEDASYIDELYLKRAEATNGIEQLLKDSLTALEDTADGRKYHDIKNPGVLAAEMGYDAINAVGHGKSGSYTVILNRSKVIIKKEGSLDGN